MTLTIGTATLTFPDVVEAFSHHYVAVTESGSNDRVEVTDGTLTINCEIYGGKARFSLLPFIRRIFTAPQLGYVGDSAMYGTITLTYKTYAGNTMTGSNNTTPFTYIYGSIGSEDEYGQDRYITYNKWLGGTLTLLTADRTGELTPQNINTLFPDYGVIAPYPETFNGALRTYDLQPWLTAYPDFREAIVTILKDYAEAVSGLTRSTASDHIKIHITQDKRKCNVAGLRWVDNAGCEWRRVFAISGEEEAVKTEYSYQEPEQNRVYNAGYDEGDRIWRCRNVGNTMTIGDDGIPMEQLPWIKGLLASSYADLKVDYRWQRINIADASLSVDTKKHIFSVSIKIELPTQGGIQW